jgi:hypothetical protein
MISLIALTISGSAQTAINLQKPIVIAANAIQLDSLLHLISKQSGAKFSINTRKFPAGKFIRVKDHNQTVGGILQEIKRNTGVHYTVLGDHIILLDNPPPAKRKTSPAVNTTHTVQAPRLPVKSSLLQKRTVTQNKNTTVQRKPPLANRQPDADKKVPYKSDTSALLHTEPIPSGDPVSYKSPVNDTGKTTSAIQVKPDSVKAPPPVRKQPKLVNDRSTSSATRQTEKRSIASNLLIKSGLLADDIFYGNPTIQVGIPYVYGIAAWSTNFRISGFRYGVGAAVPLSDEWKLHLQVTTGNLSSKFDTANQRWEFKTRLHRAGCIAEANLTRRLGVQFGPVFNLMKLTFYRAGKEVAPGLPTAHIDQKFDLIKPVYTLSDNFSINRAQSTKTWIGFQVGIFYDLNFFKHE